MRRDRWCEGQEVCWWKKVKRCTFGKRERGNDDARRWDGKRFVELPIPSPSLVALPALGTAAADGAVALRLMEEGHDDSAVASSARVVRGDERAVAADASDAVAADGAARCGHVHVLLLRENESQAAKVDEKGVVHDQGVCA